MRTIAKIIIFGMSFKLEVIRYITIGNIRAKVTDFRIMARLGDMNPHLTFIMCPGTDVYMPPEAVKDKSIIIHQKD